MDLILEIGDNMEIRYKSTRDDSKHVSASMGRYSYREFILFRSTLRK